MSGPRVGVKPAVSLTISDSVHSVGIVIAHLIECAFIVIPEAHWDWSWIVHLNWDSLEGFRDVTMQYPEEVVVIP